MLPSDATIRPHLCLTKPRAMPEAFPLAKAAFSVPCAPVPAPLMRKMPYTWPTPFVVSTRLQARIVSAPASLGSLLDASPVYVALVAWNVSPPVTEHVTWLTFETVVAAKLALAACTDVPLPCAAATPAAVSDAATTSPKSANRFLDMVSLLVGVISGRIRNKARAVHGSEQGRRKTAVNHGARPMLARVLTARRLGKRYGEKRVLRGIDLALPRGGFLVVTGPNGSGKTTLLRICAGLAQPTEGTIERSAERGQVGYLGHEPLVYRELTALENLELYGRLYRVPERRERIGMLLERFGLWEARHERVASYSRGMTQRLALCRVLLPEPELLVLDEPYSALDEAGAELLDAQLAELRGERTFLLSTHDPARVEPLASEGLALAT